MELNANFISVPINLGIGGAVQLGYKYALEHGYDIVVQIDRDGQHDAAYIPNVIDPIIENRVDIVISSRFINKEGFMQWIIRMIIRSRRRS